jgi:hypothetical protein
MLHVKQFGEISAHARQDANPHIGVSAGASAASMTF